MSKISKIFRWIDERGFAWTSLYLLRLFLVKLTNGGMVATSSIEKRLIGLETRNFITGATAISSQYHTVNQNREQWDSYDWSKAGEEWTEHALGEPTHWKASLIDDMMWKYIEPGSTVLEIGPGAGRWTEQLLTKVGRLYLADISKECLRICREKFNDKDNIKYFLVTNEGLRDIPAQSVDYIWSYDVFVHINPTNIEQYVNDFQRILKPGGYGIIHHSDEYPTEDSEFVRYNRFRSYMNATFFAHLLDKVGLVLVEQNRDLVHVHGDVISVFQKPVQAHMLQTADYISVKAEQVASAQVRS